MACLCHLQADVHVVGVSSQAAAHKSLMPKLMQELKDVGAEDMLCVIGGVIPPQDYDFLYETGVSCVFGPGSPIPKCANEILDTLEVAISHGIQVVIRVYHVLDVFESVCFFG